MALLSKKKKQEKYESELILRLHTALGAANKENTSLYKKIKILTNQLNEAYRLLSETSINRDEWQDQYLALLAKYKEVISEISKAPSPDQR